MGSPNTPKVSFSLLGKWNLETSQCGGLLGFPGWANVGVPATPATWSYYQPIMRVVRFRVHESQQDVASSESLPQSRAGRRWKKHSVLMQHCTQTLRMLAVSFYHLTLGVKIRFRLKAFIATSISIPHFLLHLHPNFLKSNSTPSFTFFFDEVFGVTFSFRSSLPRLWAIIGGHFCFIFITFCGSKAAEKHGWFDVDAFGNGGQYHFSDTFWHNLAALAGGGEERIIGILLNFLLKKTQPCTFSSLNNQNPTTNTFNILSFNILFSLHTTFSTFQTFPPQLYIFSTPNQRHFVVFQAFLPPLGCILAFAVFPTANSLAATAAPTQMATAQGLISGSRTLAEGVSPVLFGGWGGMKGVEGKISWKVTKSFSFEVVELETSERSERNETNAIILPLFFMCCHVERSNRKFWKWMSRLRRSIFSETASHWELKNDANHVQLSVGWSLMAKLFVAAYCIQKRCMYEEYTNIYQLTSRNDFGRRSSHVAKRSVPNGATELLPWLAFLSGRCLVKGFFAASIWYFIHVLVMFSGRGLDHCLVWVVTTG